MTGTDVAVGDNDEGTLEIFPPAKIPGMSAVATLREHVDAIRDAVIFAEHMTASEMVPARFRGKPKDAAAAIMFGAEVGLSPVASLRSVIVIHGQPGFEARTMKAIVKAHGYRFRTMEKTATRAEVWAWEPDSPKVFDDNGLRINPDEIGAWTIEDAAQAGYVPQKRADGKPGWELNSNGKLKGNMKYIETPKVMLEAKATAEVCRAIAPHLLLGLPYAAEELDDIGDDLADRLADADAKAKRGKGGVSELRERAAAAKAAKADALDVDEVPAEKNDAQAPAGDPEPTPEAGHATGTGNTAGAGASPNTDPPAPAPTPDPNRSTSGDEPDAGGPAAPITVDVRARGEEILGDLLDAGKIEDTDDRLAVIAEVVAKCTGSKWRAITRFSDINNNELKLAIDALRYRHGQGSDALVTYCTEALNAASLREAGLTEG